MAKKQKGYYETGFYPEPFTIESPPPPSPELVQDLQRLRFAERSKSLEDQGYNFSEPTPGSLLWDRYFNSPDRPSIAQVLLLRKTLSPKRG